MGGSTHIEYNGESEQLVLVCFEVIHNEKDNGKKEVIRVQGDMETWNIRLQNTLIFNIYSLVI